MLVSLTVGKVDAGVTVLLTPDKRLIEFPSILLPPDIESGSIVDITVGRNTASESKAEQAFRALQEQVYNSFGAAEPSAPQLRCRNATQTSVVLEWDPIQLATADLIGLALYRNGQKAGNIPRPLQMHSTKISGLAVDTEYTFHLVLRTTAGTLHSDRVAVRTHKMTDLSGITITTGILPAATRESLAKAVERIGARLADAVRIDTTHFVTTEGRGIQWEKAVEMNIPVVRPEWVDACERNGRILGVTKFYLDAMRPGPMPGEEQSRGGGAAPPPAPPAQQKDLPTAPPGSAGLSGDSRKQQQQDKAGEERKNKEGSSSGGSSEQGETEEDDNPKSAVREEQKVRVEDKDIPLRPAALSPSRGFGDDNNGRGRSAGAEDGKDDSADEKAATPGDGGSFQDVAL